MIMQDLNHIGAAVPFLGVAGTISCTLWIQFQINAQLAMVDYFAFKTSFER